MSRKTREIKDLRSQLHEVEAQHRRDADSHTHQLRQAQEEIARWKSKAETATGQLQTILSLHKNTKDLLELRTNELTHAQTFLSRTDNVSHAQVLGMVEKLNDLSFQLASRIVDSTTFPANSRSRSSDGQASIKPLLGEALTELLVFERHDEDPILMQVALQAVISNVSSELIRKWNFVLKPDEEQLLSHIHDKLFDLGELR